MIRLRNFLTGRVARQVFLLFVLAAFVPMTLIAALSYAQFRQLHLQYGEQRVAVASKEYGMAVFGRLQQAAEYALSAAQFSAQFGAQSSESRRRVAGPAAARFRWLELFDAQGHARVVLGATSAFTLPARAHERLAQGKKQVLVEPGMRGARVLLLLPADKIAPGAALAGELQPEYLWGPPDQLPSATDFCVVADGSRTLLHCPASMAEQILPTLSEPSAQTAFRPLRWTRDGETQHAVAWSQFMGAEFGTDDWLVVASQAESHQLSRVPELQKVFIPVVILTLLGVTLLSIRQIRGTLVPLEQLAEGARRIADNDFTMPVEVRRRDEFGELATAFNAMSERLARQFAVLGALSEIDRLILSMLDTEQIVRAVMERAAQALSTDCVTITLLDHDNPDLARTYSRAPREAAAMTIARQLLPANEREALDGSSQVSWRELGGAVPVYLAPLRALGMAHAYVQPIVWRGAVCGVLALGFRAPPAADDDEDLKQIREFADRVAVAMSSAWRDEQLYVQAHYDALTGLPNRLLFKDRLTLEIARCHREGGSFALLFIDLDHFKNVNDTLGHSVGDRVLREAGQRIAHCVRGSDSVARLGGDEFTVILSGLQHPKDAAIAARHIVRTLSDAFLVGDVSSFVSASIGVAIYPHDGANAEALLRNADTAMYRAKAAGRSQTVYFEERMNAQAVERVAIDRELRRAIERRELELHYQPQIDLADGAMRGAESLLRWTHPALGSVSPERFIPIAEEFGHIEQLGAWTLREACRQLRAWQADGLLVPRLAINVSGRQLHRQGLAPLVRECTGAAGIEPRLIELEITEGVLVELRGEAEHTLRELVDMGVAVSLDDFGTGFSSMAYLKRFPVHKIKIDRAFIKGLGRDSDSEPIVASIIAMAHALRMTVIAEGVETAEQLAILRRLGCDQVQGFHFSRPLRADAFAAYALRRAAQGAAPAPT